MLLDKIINLERGHVRRACKCDNIWEVAKNKFGENINDQSERIRNREIEERERSKYKLISFILFDIFCYLQIKIETCSIYQR